MKDKSNLAVFALVIFTIFVVIISNIEKEDIEKSKIKIVTNYSDFYTVNSCIQRVNYYISSNDRESLFFVLNDKYKKKNNIEKNSVISIFDEFDTLSTFSSRKMYYEKINDNVKKYYVMGEKKSDITLQTTTAYFIIYLDTKNGLYSVEPYNGEVFIGGVANE